MQTNPVLGCGCDIAFEQLQTPMFPDQEVRDAAEELKSSKDGLATIIARQKLGEEKVYKYFGDHYFRLFRPPCLILNVYRSRALYYISNDVLVILPIY